MNCQIKNKMAGKILQICFTLFSYDISSSTTTLLNILYYMSQWWQLEQTLKIIKNDISLGLCRVCVQREGAYLWTSSSLLSDSGYYFKLGPYTGWGWVAMTATARKIRRSTLINLCLHLLQCYCLINLIFWQSWHPSKCRPNM